MQCPLFFTLYGCSSTQKSVWFIAQFRSHDFMQVQYSGNKNKCIKIPLLSFILNRQSKTYKMLLLGTRECERSEAVNISAQVNILAPHSQSCLFPPHPCSKPLHSILVQVQLRCYPNPLKSTHFKKEKKKAALYFSLNLSLA